MFEEIYCWFARLEPSDWILLVTMVAIFWTAYETAKLRKWQRLQILLSIFFEQTKDWESGMRARTDYPLKLREIFETGKYDPKWPYSRNWHQPVTRRAKFMHWILSKIKKIRG